MIRKYLIIFKISYKMISAVTAEMKGIGTVPNLEARRKAGSDGLNDN